MRRLIILLLLISSAPLCAQNRVEDFASRLRVSDPANGARISIANEPALAQALRTTPSGSEVSGYRITIFSNNAQNGRALAASALATFRNAFPDIPGETVYVSPYFRVHVGYFLNRSEATMILGRVRRLFPDAILFPTRIPITQLVQEQSLALPQEEEAPEPVMVID